MTVLGVIKRRARRAFTSPVIVAGLVLFLAVSLPLFLHIVAPTPRDPLPSEKTYRTSSPSGVPTTHQLPSWHDRWLAERHASMTAPDITDSHSGAIEPAERHASSRSKAAIDSNSLSKITALGITDLHSGAIEPAELAISIVVPAYNEERRILPALEEMVKYLDAQFGRPGEEEVKPGTKKLRSRAGVGASAPSGYEIIVVDDASTDRTEEVTLKFAHEHGLHDVLRYVKLEKNRGKGGAVTHGFRHVRGEYVVFADADGASRFSDLSNLIEACEGELGSSRRGVAIGSRAHMVGSEVVVKRSPFRNFLMRSFHFLLTILMPSATSQILDTQCGFKLFTRSAIPHIVPYMHTEGWIFDIEMLMLAESAHAAAARGSDGRVLGAVRGIKIVEVPVAWREVSGSKLNMVDASVRMAFGLVVLRLNWMLGVYRRRIA